MAVDYTPTLKPYEKVGAFRYWCQTTLPLVYDDSKSYLELLYSVIHYLNSTISDVANMGGNIDDLLKAYNLLQGYVNDYFDNLDVQEEINAKLDALVADGTLSELLEPFTTGFNRRLETLESRMNEFVQLPEGSTTGDAELVDIRVGVDGAKYETAGDAVRTQVNGVLEDLNTLQMYRYAGMVSESGNGFVNMSGVITANNNYKWLKYEPHAGAILLEVSSIYVPAYQSTLAVFAFFDSANILLKVVSNVDINSGSAQAEFRNVRATIPYGTAYVYVTFGNMASSTVLQTVREIGFYKPEMAERVFSQPLDGSYNEQFYFHIHPDTNANPTTINVRFETERPIVSYSVLFTGYAQDYTGRVITQYRENLTNGIDGNVVEIAENFHNTSTGLTTYWVGAIINLKYDRPSLDSGAQMRRMYTYATTAKYCTVNDVPVELAQYPTAGYYVTAVNKGREHNPLYGGFLCAIGDSLTAVYYKAESETWVHLIAEWNSMRYENLGISGNPIAKASGYTDADCMAERVDDLEALKHYSHILVMGGANDYNFGVPIGTNGDTTITTFKGAINHIITTLTQKFPTAHIMFATTYRRVENYADRPYADAMLEVCALRSIPCLDQYRGSGVQFFDSNWMYIFGATNALGNNHLNASGDLFVAPRIEAFLKGGIV